MFKPLVDGYKYQLVENTLLTDSDVNKLSDDLKEDEYELCAERLEEHVDSMLTHLNDLEPTLSTLEKNINREHYKIGHLTNHYSAIN